MKNNIFENSKDKTTCCGCAACYHICSKSAIEMNADCEGFVYPTINLELCTNCHLCIMVCPMAGDKMEV